MDCADEVAILKRELSSVVDTDQALQFDILRGKMTVDAQGSSITAPDIQAVRCATGFPAA
jgi:Cd2+/Zn2+-exporting ATPase